MAAKPEGVESCPLDDGALETALAWAGGDGSARSPLGGGAWMLAHTDAGVCWGRSDGGPVRTGRGLYAGWDVPPVGRDTLQQLRIFDAGHEVRIWRTGHERGVLAGVRLKDVPHPEGGPTAVETVHLPLLGRLTTRSDGFALHRGAGGFGHVAPLPPDGPGGDARVALVAHRYFEQLDNGAVRACLTRLAGLAWRTTYDLDLCRS